MFAAVLSPSLLPPTGLTNPKVLPGRPANIQERQPAADEGDGREAEDRPPRHHMASFREETSIEEQEGKFDGPDGRPK